MKQRTSQFDPLRENPEKVAQIMRNVTQALNEKGYNTVDQIVGYLMSGEPVYITSHNGARAAISRIDRHEILEQMVKLYIEHIMTSSDMREEEEE